MGSDGRPSFSSAAGPAQPWPGRKRSALVYQVFDLHLDGRSLLDALGERRSCCARCCGEHRSVRATTWVDGDGEDYFEAVKAQGLEG